MELAEYFPPHPHGNLGIWLKCWYLVLFLFLVLTLRLLFFLSLSASTDASWPLGSVNPFQPALGWLCQGSILLGIAGNPHGSLPSDVYTAPLPLLPFPQPGFFHWTKPHQKRAGTTQRPGRKTICKADRCFPSCLRHSYEEAEAHRGEVTQLGIYELELKPRSSDHRTCAHFTAPQIVSLYFQWKKCVLCTQSCPTLCDALDCSPLGSSVPGIFQVKNIGRGFHFLLHGIFLTQGLNPHFLCLLRCRHILYHWAIREVQYLSVRWKEFFVSFSLSSTVYLGFLNALFSLILQRGKLKISSSWVVMRDLCNHKVLSLERKQRWCNSSKWWNPSQLCTH